MTSSTGSRRRQALRGTALIGTALLAATLAGCGTDAPADRSTAAEGGRTQEKAAAPVDASLPPAQRVAAIVTGTASRTARVSTTVTLKGSSKPFMEADGEMDSAAQASRLDFTAPAETEQIVVGGDTYVRGFAGGPKDTWTKFTAGDLDLSGSGAAPANYGDQLLLLTRATGVREKGSSKVGGTSTTKYTGKVDLTTTTGDDDVAKRIADDVKRLRALGMSSVPFTLHVGQDGLPARLELVFQVGELLGSTERTTFTDWGLEVSIAVPTKVATG